MSDLFEKGLVFLVVDKYLICSGFACQDILFQRGNACLLEFQPFMKFLEDLTPVLVLFDAAFFVLLLCLFFLF